jgi:hypothetical protein
MHAKRDDLKDSFYLYIMRNSIGTGLRSQYAPNGQMPDRLAELLKKLNSAKNHGVEAASRRGGTSGKDKAVAEVIPWSHIEPKRNPAGSVACCTAAPRFASLDPGYGTSLYAAALQPASPFRPG